MMKISMRAIQGKKLIFRLLNEPIEDCGGLFERVEGKNW